MLFQLLGYFTCVVVGCLVGVVVTGMTAGGRITDLSERIDRLDRQTEEQRETVERLAVALREIAYHADAGTPQDVADLAKAALAA